MTQPVWQKLVELVSFEQKSISISDDISKLEADVAAKQAQISSSANRGSELKAGRLQKRKEIDLIELKILELDNLEKEKKVALEAIKTQKEADAITKELEVLSTSQQDQEDLLMRTLHELEQTEKKYDEQGILEEEQTVEIEKEITDLQAQVKTLQTELIEVNAKKTASLEQLPPEWATRYKRMKGRVNDPVVSTLGESCSVCYYQILSQDLARIRKGELLPCRNCYRFLYLEQPKPELEPEATE